MLKKMYLTNFLSFKDRTEFIFTASKSNILSEENVYTNRILKGALFIGANASGKSNALAGISFIVNLIKGEGVSIIRHRCFFADSAITSAEYEFDFDGRKVVYLIKYNVGTNSLSENLDIDGVTFLKREGNRGELRIEQNPIVDEQVDSQTLFLRTASFNTGRFPQEPTLRKLMDYLMNSYVIDGYNIGATTGKSIIKYADEFGVEKINHYLDEFNYDFFVEYGSESEGARHKIVLGDNYKTVFFKRKSYPIPSIFFDESQGNQVFADLMSNLIPVIENPGMLIIDEFGNSLHNKLAEKIVRFFMKKTKDSQLFITSHHTNLVSNAVFRPDQINIVSFEGELGSVVNHVSQFKPREAQNLEKMYLGGMFEGLPFYEKI